MLKENKKILINCLIVFVLQILALIYKPFVFVELIYLIVLLAVDKVENKIVYLFFMLPFYNVFRYDAGYVLYENILDGIKSLYLSVLLVLAFCVIMFIKFMIDIRRKAKTFNWKQFLIWVAIYVSLILPIKQINTETISSFLTISSLFASLYFIVQYKEYFKLKKILDIWLLSIILTTALYFFKGSLPYLESYLCWFTNRFFGIHRDPNYFSFELFVLLVGYTILLFRREIKYYFVLPFVLVSVLGFLAVSKSFLISYAVYLLICLVYLIIFILRKIKDKKRKILIILSIVTVFVVAIIIISLLVLPKLLSQRNDTLTLKGNSLYSWVDALTTGRLNIWVENLKYILGSFITLMFGHGALNGYPLEALHNTPLQLLLFGGLVGIGAIVASLIYQMKKKKQPVYVYLMLSVILLFTCSLDLLFSYRTYLILAMVVLVWCNDEAQIKGIKHDSMLVPSVNNKEQYMVSIVVPVYNVEKYLDRCINSIVNQSYRNLEIILVDDGSPDGSPKLCDEWAQKDKRIKVVHKENGGVSSARNKGIELATGDYVTFVDSDDYLSENFSVCLSMLNFENVYCFAHNAVVDGREKKVQANSNWGINIQNDFNDGKILSDLYNSVCNKIFKISFLKTNNVKFDESLRIAEDLKFVMRCLMIDPAMRFINIAYYNYFQNSDSAMHSVSFAKIQDTLQVCKFGIANLSKVKDIKMQQFLRKLISENLLSVFARVSDYDVKENEFLIKELNSLKKYLCYGSSMVKKLIVVLVKILGIKNSSKLLKLKKLKITHRNKEKL